MSLVALILGAGPGIGQSVARKLIGEGYKVAAASRNPDLAIAKEIGFHPIKLDLSNTEEIPNVFAQVQKELGGFPSVVIYNAYAFTAAPDAEDILSEISAATLARDFNVNTIGLWAAARVAVAGWEKLDSAVPKAFIFTGNLLPWINIPKYVTLGIGKAASAHIIESLASTYGKRGSRFYFAYQVNDVDGGLYMGIDGPLTATTYLDVIKRSEQGSWRVGFDKNGKDWVAAA
ncbi:hypothetical protein Q9L58_002942 [Maublancomyces gigas]|uniref:Uncharacterized protein n=1 Tax=Discina gigas TaxID=1032678 RepID=A0ABR3GQJ7_9PEZI